MDGGVLRFSHGELGLDLALFNIVHYIGMRVVNIQAILYWQLYQGGINQRFCV